jgi:HlyD family secretion protein
MSRKRKLVLICAVVVAIAAGAAAWLIFSNRGLPPGIAASNGRIEATEVDIATKYPGRIKQVMVDEGDTVNAGQVVAIMDTEPLEAQLSAAEAKIREAQDNLRTAQADVNVRQAESTFASKQYQRSQGLVGNGAVSQQELDVDRAKADSASAALTGANAQVTRSRSSIDAATGEADRLRAEIADNTLKAPVRARVESRVAQAGEVLPAGGKVYTTYDLADVYMYVFLPTDTVGKIRMGSEARIVLDALPDNPIQATVAYVSPTAQFTPKTVETAEERHNLSFRVKLQIPRERLMAVESLVKTGIPGMGYVRVDQATPWPEQLQLRRLAEAPSDLPRPTPR